MPTSAKPQQLEQPHRRAIAAAAPGDEAEDRPWPATATIDSATDHGVPRNVSDRETFMPRLPADAPAWAGRGRPRPPWPPSWRPGTSARSPGSTSSMLPARSSTRAKSSPRNKLGHLGGRPAPAPAPRRRAVDRQQPLARLVNAAVKREIGRERLLGPGHALPERRVVAGRLAGRELARAAQRRGARRQARAGPARKRRRRSSPATNRPAPASSRRSRPTRGRSRPAPAAAARPRSVASGVTSPESPQYFLTCEPADRQRHARWRCGPASPGRRASSTHRNRRLLVGPGRPAHTEELAAARDVAAERRWPNRRGR